MRLQKRLVVIGIALVILSTVMATQYATSRVGYEYTIVHPSDADIRFVACDNSSDNITVLRLAGTNGTNVALKLHLGGNFSAGYNKTYTAAFAIVNEELFKVNITRINVSTSAGDACLQIWLHKNRTKRVENDAGSVFMWDKTVSKAPVASPAWVLGAGNGNPNNINVHLGQRHGQIMVFVLPIIRMQQSMVPQILYGYKFLSMFHFHQQVEHTPV